MVTAELKQAENAGRRSTESPLAVRRRPKRLGSFSYRDPAHAELPHVVSFSGGRSSAALTFMAAEEGLLDPGRGDIVLFANTSAEHPGTYEFAAECKRRIETDFGLPFFWLEFTTVEDAWRGEYWRKLSYRLVKPVPIEDDPEGFRSSGELFEDLVSLQGMLPNVHSRTCTAKLKLYPSHLLLSEWLGGTEGPAHAGHYWSVPDDETGGGSCQPRAGRESLCANARYRPAGISNPQG
ncbi:MAG: phosphoadenosine phosphosulfate reductase family protein [Acidimicrobiales bacterium]|nr:phosphoadenosine phosphosulfate reductase family protein [Acidimicrobiales bacterium]MYB80208.1 phosphoadenosine phosphosulfate reductase family protein [Acidimicrobiales bacterium]MYI12654.1 phosphoadenosine phosphosulfate reductase family protein [Acidimicrobiales bacterium]